MPSTVNSPSTIMPALRYRNAPAAIDWLCQVLGFARHAVYPGPDNTIGHAELTLGGGMIMLGSYKEDAYASRFKSPEDLGGFETRSAYVIVPDTDAVYARAKAGLIKNFTGIDSPYEAPENPDLRLDTLQETLAQSAARVVALLQERQILGWGGAGRGDTQTWI